MGRKSSAKSPRTPPPPPSTDSASSSSRSLVIVGLLALVALAGGFTYWRSSQPQPETAAASQSAAQAVAPPPAAALLGPHPQPNLPPIPFNSEPPARSPEVVRAAYRFAAEHPEVLSYVPCYCGCEHSGHRGNEDCFVTARDDKGDVTEWEPHGVT